MEEGDTGEFEKEGRGRQGGVGGAFSHVSFFPTLFGHRPRLYFEAEKRVPSMIVIANARRY